MTVPARDLVSGKWLGGRMGGGKPFQQRARVNFTPETLPTPPPSGPVKLAGPLLFTIGFSGACFSVAAIWEYERLRSRALDIKKKALGWIRPAPAEKHGQLRSDLNAWWNKQRPGHKIFYAIFFANSLVLAAWRVPRLTTAMSTYFCANPFARTVCWPMVLSTFSHYSLWHFGANMYVLYSFCGAASQSMGPHQLTAFYLSGGVFSSVVSHFAKAAMRTTTPSLGASGAIMAVLGYFCTQHPDSKLAVAFLPQWSFSADSGLKALMAFDAVGLLLRWKLFDHAAHLGGALFGVMWSLWGQQNLWGNRDHVMEAWHRLRTRFTD